MIGVNAISGGMVIAAMFVGLTLLLLTGVIAGIVFRRERPKTGWFLIAASMASLIALAAWLYNVLHVPRESIAVRLGAPWQEKTGTCTESAGEKMCFPPHAYYTITIALPDGSSRIFEGDQLFFQVGSDGRIFAVQASQHPTPTTDAFGTLLALALQDGSSSYRGCGGIRGVPVMEAYRHWLSVQKAGDCNVEVRHAEYLVHFDIQGSGGRGESVFVWHRLQLISPDDRSAKNRY